MLIMPSKLTRAPSGGLALENGTYKPARRIIDPILCQSHSAFKPPSLVLSPVSKVIATAASSPILTPSRCGQRPAEMAKRQFNLTFGLCGPSDGTCMVRRAGN